VQYRWIGQDVLGCMLVRFIGVEVMRYINLRSLLTYLLTYSEPAGRNSISKKSPWYIRLMHGYSNRRRRHGDKPAANSDHGYYWSHRDARHCWKSRSIVVNISHPVNYLHAECVCMSLKFSYWVHF